MKLDSCLIGRGVHFHKDFLPNYSWKALFWMPMIQPDFISILHLSHLINKVTYLIFFVILSSSFKYYFTHEELMLFARSLKTWIQFFWSWKRLKKHECIHFYKLNKLRKMRISFCFWQAKSFQKRQIYYFFKWKKLKNINYRFAKYDGVVEWIWWSHGIDFENVHFSKNQNLNNFYVFLLTNRFHDS